MDNMDKINVEETKNSINTVGSSMDSPNLNSVDIKRLEDICEGALYQEVKQLKDGKSIVMDKENEKLYYRKELTVYNISVFDYIKNNKCKWIPEIKVFWEEENKLICIEEFIEGKTLEEYLELRPTFEDRKRILMDICDGISFLHSANPPIIHRDIKASNIMITNEGTVKIIDYDAAKQFVANKSKDTVLMGTQGIAAPEQYGFGQSDERTDIYAMGRLIERVLYDVRDAEKIISKATRIDPALRYGSIAELRNHIERLWDPAISKSLRRKLTYEKVVKSRAFKRGMAISIISLFLIVFIVGGIKLFKTYIYPTQFIYKPAYERGVKAMNNEDYETAIEEFSLCEGYKDSEDLSEKCDNIISYEMHKKDAEDKIDVFWETKSKDDLEKALIAIKLIPECDGKEDVDEIFQSFCKEVEDYIETCIEEYNWDKAKVLYIALYSCGYEEAKDGDKEVIYQQAEYNVEREKYKYAHDYFATISGYKDADDRATECEYQYGLQCMEDGDYTKAVDTFETISGYSDADEKRLLAMYKYCDKMKEKRDMTAKKYMDILLEENYAGALELSEVLYAWHANITLLNGGWSGNTRSIEIRVKLKGGPFLENAKITVKVYDENNKLDFEETKEDVVVESVTNMRYSYAYSKGELSERTFSVYVYDGDGNLIGSTTHYAN